VLLEQVEHRQLGLDGVGAQERLVSGGVEGVQRQHDPRVERGQPLQLRLVQ